MAAGDIRDLAAVQVATDLLASINANRTILNNAIALASSFSAFVGIGSGPPPLNVPAGQLIYLDQTEPAIYLREAGGAWSGGLIATYVAPFGSLSLDFCAPGALLLA